MLKIILNQNEILLEHKISLNEILQLYYPSISHYSIAINQRFIPRDRYTEIHLKDGDVVDIISPMQGG